MNYAAMNIEAINESTAPGFIEGDARAPDADSIVTLLKE
jgi:hypothetical protein